MNLTRILFIAAAVAVVVGTVFVATRSNTPTNTETALDNINGFQSAPPTQDATLAPGNDYNSPDVPAVNPAAGPDAATETGPNTPAGGSTLTSDPLEAATTPPTNASATVTTPEQLPNPPQPTGVNQ